MPSFDIVSKVKKDEVQNAVDNASRELAGRYDFRGTESSFKLMKEDLSVKLDAPEDFHIQQMDEILRQKLAKRNIEASSAEFSEITRSGKRSVQTVTFKQGIDSLQRRSSKRSRMQSLRLIPSFLMMPYGSQEKNVMICRPPSPWFVRPSLISLCSTRISETDGREHE